FSAGLLRALERTVARAAEHPVLVLGGRESRADDRAGGEAERAEHERLLLEQLVEGRACVGELVAGRHCSPARALADGMRRAGHGRPRTLEAAARRATAFLELVAGVRNGLSRARYPALRLRPPLGTLVRALGAPDTAVPAAAVRHHHPGEADRGEQQ